jgi:hypothetical protein
MIKSIDCSLGDLLKELSSLSGWPPQGGGGPYDTRKADFANNPESVTLKRVNRIVGTRIDMTCAFGKEIVDFRFFASDRGTAENVAKVLACNSGKSLVDLGLLTVENCEWAG